MKFYFVILMLALAATGCTSRSKARMKEQTAFLAGQNSALRQQQAAQGPGVTIVGAVQHPQVPWVAGLTLVQAVATANYINQDAPKKIIITRQGESAALDAAILFNGPDIPLEVGDVIELR